jgi:hypothetical protein
VTTPKPKKSRPRRRIVSKAGVSWMALLAATTVGIGTVQRVRAAVSADPTKLAGSERGYRLIVQSYARSSLGTGQLPRQREKPLASTQRAITPAELARGVAVRIWTSTLWTLVRERTLFTESPRPPRGPSRARSPASSSSSTSSADRPARGSRRLCAFERLIF